MPALLLTVLLGLAPLPAADAPGGGTRPCVESRSEPTSPSRPCVGPVTDESGGGGGSVTIVVSVVVGLAVAVGAMVVVRHRMLDGGR